MKLLLTLCVALIGASAYLSVKAQEEPQPLVHEIGERIAGDALVNLYYEHTTETAVPSTHTATIIWDYTANINFARIFVYDAVSSSNAPILSRLIDS